MFDLDFFVDTVIWNGYMEIRHVDMENLFHSAKNGGSAVKQEGIHYKINSIICHAKEFEHIIPNIISRAGSRVNQETAVYLNVPSSSHGMEN